MTRWNADMGRPIHAPWPGWRMFAIFALVTAAVYFVALSQVRGETLEFSFRHSTPAPLNDRPNCIVNGVAAVCHSEAVVRRAIALARRCGGSWIAVESLETTRGPYRDPSLLAADACRQ